MRRGASLSARGCYRAPRRVGRPGGATYSLVDTVGGAAVISLTESVTPTIDMRIDYLAPTTGDLTATADVLRASESVAGATVEMRDADRQVASARGVYKTGDHGSKTA